MFDFDGDVMEYMLNDCVIPLLLGISRTSAYLDFKSSIKDHNNVARSTNIPLNNSTFDDNEDFYDEINNTFLYDVFQQGENVVIKLKCEYIKQHTTVAFPSIIFVSKELKQIKYRITSKNNPDIINGIIQTSEAENI